MGFLWDFMGKTIIEYLVNVTSGSIMMLVTQLGTPMDQAEKRLFFFLNAQTCTDKREARFFLEANDRER